LRVRNFIFRKPPSVFIQWQGTPAAYTWAETRVISGVSKSMSYSYNLDGLRKQIAPSVAHSSNSARRNSRVGFRYRVPCRYYVMHKRQVASYSRISHRRLRPCFSRIAAYRHPISQKKTSEERARKHDAPSCDSDHETLCRIERPSGCAIQDFKMNEE
jgi:hypothetical protein